MEKKIEDMSQEIIDAIRFGVEKGIEKQKRDQELISGRKEGTILSLDAYVDNCVDLYENLPEEKRYCTYSGCMSRAIYTVWRDNFYCTYHYEKHEENCMD